MKQIFLIVMVFIGTEIRRADADFALSFSLPQTTAPSGGFVNGVDGFEFIPNVDLSVTALGWYDHEGDGLLHDHAVGIFDTATQLLVAPAVTVTNASSLEPTTNFRYQSIVPFTLNAGVSYTLAGYGEGPVFDPYITNPNGGLIVGQNLNFVRYRTDAASGLSFPTLSGQDGDTSAVFMGPNFSYITAVPEPGSVCLMGTASLLLWAKRLGRRKREK